MPAARLCLLLLIGLNLGLNFGFNLVYAQSPWASSVFDYQFGTSQTVGQSPDVFPANVLGPVTAPVGPTVPAVSPEQVVSLGKSGFVVLGFEAPIINGPGADFTVFENAFIIQSGGVFEEWLRVAVSPDGVNWFTFPYDSLTGAGLAGRTPTGAAGSNFGDTTQSGGDFFDLALLGLDTVQFVRLSDATDLQPPDRLSAEVDAVRALHQAAPSHRPALATTRPEPPLRTWLNANGQVVVHSPEPLSALHLRSAEGKLLFSAEPGTRRATFNLPRAAAHLLLVQARTEGGQHFTQKIWVGQP